MPIRKQNALRVWLEKMSKSAEDSNKAAYLMRFALLTGVIALLAAGCFHASRQTPGNDRSPHGVHAVHSLRLERIMHTLDRQLRRTWPQELTDGEGSAQVRNLRTVSQRAEKLAEAADRIPEAIAQLSLPNPDREQFLSEARALRDHALALQDAALRREIHRMNDSFKEIELSCDRCHQRFRDVAGPLR